ncbi:MAG: Zn-dependent exopeptidase M28 [Candidatus Heimdallarchaeota archaeon]|nr:Zn-dependent exopeptidase M28 [Candidatus Heimdallarchaeota archaeon]
MKKCGPRLAGSEGVKQARDIIKGLYEESCDSVRIEEFDIRPTSFLGLIRYSAILFIISSFFIYSDLIYLATIGYSLAFFMILSQSFMYWEVFDRFFTKKSGYNIIGNIEPEGEVKQQIIVSGHHDAPYAFHLLEKVPKLYGILVIAANLTILSSLILSNWWMFSLLITGNNPSSASAIRIWLLFAIIPVLPFLFFITKTVSPGAGDNMIASVMTIKTASIFGKLKKSHENALQHTRLLVASFDAEEAGLRGARAYVRKNLKELQSVPTYVFNIDSIYEAKNLKLFSRDLNSRVRLSDTMIETCQKVASDLNLELQAIPMPFGGGATDAAEFAKEGIHATTLIGLSTSFVRNETHYHTQYDTVDKIEPEAVEISLKLVVNTISHIDTNDPFRNY